MTSIFRAALGADFERLHPAMQKRFDVGIENGYACVGTGTMRRIRRGPWWTVPFLYFGAIRNILVPDNADNVPFVVENFPYLDPFGRETVTFVRTYTVGRKRRRFDATMIYSDQLTRIVDYLGTHQHLAVDLDLAVTESGGLRLKSGAQRIYEGPLLAFRFPMLLSGHADLHEDFDDEAGEYRIRLEVRNRVFGFLFGYEGSFTCEFPKATDAPSHTKPLRHERRE